MLLRRSKSCKGCGTPASNHSPSSVSADNVGAASALLVSLKNDPMVIERTVNRLIYEEHLVGASAAVAEYEPNPNNFFPKVDGKLFKPEDLEKMPTLGPSGRGKEEAPEPVAYQEPEPKGGNGSSGYDFHQTKTPEPAESKSFDFPLANDQPKSFPAPFLPGTEEDEQPPAVYDDRSPDITEARNEAVEEPSASSAEVRSGFDAAPATNNVFIPTPSPEPKLETSPEPQPEPVAEPAQAKPEAVSGPKHAAPGLSPEQAAAAIAASATAAASTAAAAKGAEDPPETKVVPKVVPSFKENFFSATMEPEKTKLVYDETRGADRSSTASSDSMSFIPASVDEDGEERSKKKTKDKKGSHQERDRERYREKEQEKEKAKKKAEEKAKAKAEEKAEAKEKAKAKIKAKSAKVIDEEIEEEEEEEEGDDETEDSEESDSKSTKGKKKKSKTSKGSKDETPAEQRRRERRERFSKNYNKSREPEQIIQIGSKSFKKSTLVTSAVLLFFAGFPMLVLVSNVFTIVRDLGGGGKQQQTASGGPTSAGPATAAPQGAVVGANGLTGKWDLAFQNGKGGVGRGIMELNQLSDKITGWGIDNNGQFQVIGSLLGTTVTFTKNYVQGGQPVGKPIQYQGALVTGKDKSGNPVSQIAGNWQLSKREGYSWRGKVVTYSGQFLARYSGAISGGAATGTGTGTGTDTGSALTSNTSSPAAKDPRKAHDFFLQIAVGIIGLGVAIAMASLKFFGPSGLLNVWAKKEYIPSQFKSQHNQMVREMGKPLRPGGLPLGEREEWGLHQFWLPKKLVLPLDIREKNPHFLLLGAGATGKSRLMASFIAQDILSNDRAVVLVDSDGGLSDLILDWIATQANGATLAKRVIVVDPTTTDRSIAYNPLEFPEDGDLQSCASSIVFGFKAAYTEPPGSQSQWNQQTANILRNAAVLLIANNRTLTDLPVLLADNDFRDVLLEKIEKVKHERSEYITLIDAWTNYKRMARTDQWITWIEPILNRVQPMLSDPRLRSILTKPKSELNLLDVIKKKQILIVKIPQGNLDKNGNLLGSLMVAGVKQAALSLSSKSRGAISRPCALYLDELESFIEKETFDSITTETRKLQIGFCAASKTLQTLPEDFRNQIVINVGIIAIFALAKKDADMLGPQMFRVDGRKVKHQTISNVMNKVNSAPQFELIMDEEKLNIDRVVGQEKQTYFCYRVGSVAGVFRLKSPDFPDVDQEKVNKDLIEKMRANRQEFMEEDEEDADEDEDAEDADDNDDEEDDDDDDSEASTSPKDTKTKLITADSEGNTIFKSKNTQKRTARKEHEEDEDEDEDEDDDDEVVDEDEEDEEDDEDEEEEGDEDEKVAARSKSKKSAKSSGKSTVKTKKKKS